LFVRREFQRVNAFACLGLEVRPWLEPGVVRAAQQAVLARVHPDVAGGDGDEGRQVNEAAARLATPGLVLAHFLECHGQAAVASVQPVPGDLADLFMALAAPMGRAEEILRAGAACETFLERAELAESALEVMDALRGQLEGLRARQEEVHGRIRRAAEGEPPDWEELRRCALELAFLERWARDADERVFQLAELAAG
jgi:hypothetical protein